MNLQSAMDYARHANTAKESIVCLIKWRKNYCVFNLFYEPEPHDEPPYYCIEYVGGRFQDVHSVEGENYSGENYSELIEDLIEFISPDQLQFQIYQTRVNMDLMIPYIYRELLPDLIPDYEVVDDKSFYQHQVDRTLHYINRV